MGRWGDKFTHDRAILKHRGTSNRLIGMLRFLFLMLVSAMHAHAADKPNFIFILCDDLAQGDCGSYGQKLIQTPNLDRMAREGTRYLQAYCGTSVCAPSRSSLMTGLHMGHCPIRANREAKPEGQKPLPEGTYTVAKHLKQAGYATAVTGKWGMGMFGTSGSPFAMGFDRFYGYNCQRHAHSYFPTHLFDNDKRIELPGNDGNVEVEGKGKIYAQNLIADQTLKWVRAQQDKPFFLFYAITLPHGAYHIDDQGIYKDKPWTVQQKNYAAMVTRLDADVGRLLDLLEEMGIEKKTLVMFSGDNGASFAPDSENGKLFDQSMGGKLRGFKRSMYEGALRQASFAWWPGTVPAGRVSDEPWAFWDYLPTVAELSGTHIPANVPADGLSLASYLKGGAVPKRECFYWELHEGAPIQAVRWDDWKAVRNGVNKPMELYDLKADVSEARNIAAKHPELVAKAEALMKASRVDHPDWPLSAKKPDKKKSR
jgi:arylsulfatase A